MRHLPHPITTATVSDPRDTCLRLSIVLSGDYGIPNYIVERPGIAWDVVAGDEEIKVHRFVR